MKVGEKAPVSCSFVAVILCTVFTQWGGSKIIGIFLTYKPSYMAYQVKDTQKPTLPEALWSFISYFELVDVTTYLAGGNLYPDLVV